MENLYIKFNSLGFVDHPHLESNLLKAYPDIDLNNLPQNWAKFTRVPKPECGVYEVVVPSEYGTYVWDEIGKSAKDFWVIREMTIDEKTMKIALKKLEWTRGVAYPSWTFDESICWYKAPVPMPQDGKKYSWNEAGQSWDLFE